MEQREKETGILDKKAMRGKKRKYKRRKIADEMGLEMYRH